MQGKSNPQFAINDYDISPSTGFKFIGLEDEVGSWTILRIAGEASEDLSIRYASTKNNSTKQSYASAWAARTALSYGTYKEGGIGNTFFLDLFGAGGGGGGGTTPTFSDVLLIEGTDTLLINDDGDQLLLGT